MRWLVVSVVVHAIVLAVLVGTQRAPDVVHSHLVGAQPATATPAQDVVIEVIAMSSGGGSPSTTSARAAAVPRRAPDAWQRVVVSEERGQQGQGQGRGEGQAGTGIGFGDGGGIGNVARDIPAPPAPVVEAVSKARPAVLVWPTRDEDVEDEADLFVAQITVDEDGSVVGARMIKTRPGARGDDAANAIWRFRYLPALDDRGAPIRSTFQQPFQVR